MEKNTKGNKLEEVKKNLKPVKKEDMKKIKGGKGKNWYNGCTDIIPQ
ncbi:MAG: hypothetical protein ACKOA4_03580 [Haliscomenobacter sp.]|jgi:hypothetical protein